MNVFTLLRQTARRWPDAPAVCSGAGVLQNWAALERGALAIAAALRADCAPGARIAVVSANCPGYVQTLFGIWAAGMAAVPINYKLHPREVVSILEDAEAASVFVSPTWATALQPLLPAASRLLPLPAPGDAASTATEPAEPAEPAPEDLAWLFFTSGTTGRSKGAMLSHRNLLAMTIAHLADIETIDEQCSQLHAAPMSHGSGIYILPAVARGARQVIPASESFEPAEFLALCDQHPGCGAFLAPTMIHRLRLEVEASGRPVPAGLRSIVYGGGPMYVEDLRRVLTLFGPLFAQIYGQGESPMTITGLTRRDHIDADEAQLGSVGVARSGVEVRVVDSAGRPQPAGEIGEIIVRGDVVMQGYWRQPAATAEALRDGWLWTGDLGSFDDRGFLTLRDRSKDLIISGGSNVYPREIEEVLLASDEVLEACVIGRPDAEWGEAIVACIVARDPTLADDAAASAALAERLDRLCLDRIARFKRPRHYRFLAALPKSSYGKVLKRELRAADL